MDNKQTLSSKAFNIKHRIYLVFSLIIAAVFTFLQTDLLYFFYDTDVFLFAADTELPQIYYTALLICVLLVASSFIFFRKETFPEQLPQTKSITVFVSSLCGCILLILFIIKIYNLVINIEYIAWNLHSGLKLLAALCAVPAAIYFVVIAIKKDPYKKTTAILGFFVVLWATFNLMGEYFNMNTPLNNPVRVLHQISYISIMLFFLYDAGYSADIRKPVLYHLYGYLAILFISLSTIPTIILNLFNLKAVTIDLMSCYVEFNLLLFIICRMFSIKKLPTNNLFREDN